MDNVLKAAEAGSREAPSGERYPPLLLLLLLDERCACEGGGYRRLREEEGGGGGGRGGRGLARGAAALLAPWPRHVACALAAALALGGALLLLLALLAAAGLSAPGEAARGATRARRLCAGAGCGQVSAPASAPDAALPPTPPPPDAAAPQPASAWLRRLVGLLDPAPASALPLRRPAPGEPRREPLPGDAPTASVPAPPSATAPSVASALAAPSPSLPLAFADGGVALPGPSVPAAPAPLRSPVTTEIDSAFLPSLGDFASFQRVSFAFAVPSYDDVSPPSQSSGFSSTKNSDFLFLPAVMMSDFPSVPALLSSSASLLPALSPCSTADCSVPYASTSTFDRSGAAYVSGTNPIAGALFLPLTRKQPSETDFDDPLFDRQSSFRLRSDIFIDPNVIPHSVDMCDDLIPSLSVASLGDAAPCRHRRTVRLSPGIDPLSVYDISHSDSLANSHSRRHEEAVSYPAYPMPCSHPHSACRHHAPRGGTPQQHDILDGVPLSLRDTHYAPDSSHQIPRLHFRNASSRPKKLHVAAQRSTPHHAFFDPRHSQPSSPRHHQPSHHHFHDVRCSASTPLTSSAHLTPLRLQTLPSVHHRKAHYTHPRRVHIVHEASAENSHRLVAGAAATEHRRSLVTRCFPPRAVHVHYCPDGGGCRLKRFARVHRPHCAPSPHAPPRHRRTLRPDNPATRLRLPRSVSSAAIDHQVPLAPVAVLGRRLCYDHAQRSQTPPPALPATPPPAALTPAPGDLGAATGWAATLEPADAPPVFFVGADGDALSGGQLCALESAARAAPGARVRLLVLTAQPDGRAARWPAPPAAPAASADAAADALHAVLHAHPNLQVVAAPAEALFGRSPLHALWARERERRGRQGEQPPRFSPALRLGARALALWEFGGTALDLGLLTLRDVHSGDAHSDDNAPRDAVRLDAKEALVLGAAERCHAFLFELLRALAAEASSEASWEPASEAQLLERAAARALPSFCAGGPALEVGGDGALAARVQCAGAAPVPEALLCRAAAPLAPSCAWTPLEGAAARGVRLRTVCPLAAAAALTSQ